MTTYTACNLGPNAIIVGRPLAQRRSLLGERSSPPMAASSPALPSPNGDAKAHVSASERTGNILHGDCVQTMRPMHSGSVDFILTDPPYLVRYRSRDGRSIANDDNARWLRPAFAEMYRLLKHGSFCVSFYGWNKADQFIAAWRAAGFHIVGHIVFRKRYASSVRFLRYEHEAAYLLAKGDAKPPATPAADVLDWCYTGNRLHPTEKPVDALKPLIAAFCPTNGLVLDPFCGSGSTLVAAKELGRRYVGIELEGAHFRTASRRLQTSDRSAP